jgi:hypothetical protein
MLAVPYVFCVFLNTYIKVSAGSAGLSFCAGKMRHQLY